MVRDVIVLVHGNVFRVEALICDRPRATLATQPVEKQRGRSPALLETAVFDRNYVPWPACPENAPEQ